MLRESISTEARLYLKARCHCSSALDLFSEFSIRQLLVSCIMAFSYWAKLASLHGSDS